MYLKQLYVENNGPIRRAHLELPFTPEGAPKPLVLVGGNGSGKTNLLSIVADALFEAAKRHYTDVTPAGALGGRPWFRVVGPVTISLDAPGSASILQFDHEGTTLFFKEKGGTLPAIELSERIPASLRPAIKWADNTNSVKQFAVPSDTARAIFDDGVYVYFSSNRNEIPSWLNRESVTPDSFDIAPRFTTRLQKSLYMERSLDPFKQWLLSVLFESRTDLGRTDDNRTTIVKTTALHLANFCLRCILDDNDVRFVWRGRHDSLKLGIAKGDLPWSPCLPDNPHCLEYLAQSFVTETVTSGEALF